MKLLGLGDKFWGSEVVAIYKGGVELADGRHVTALQVETNLDQIRKAK